MQFAFFFKQGIYKISDMLHVNALFLLKSNYKCIRQAGLSVIKQIKRRAELIFSRFIKKS